MPTEPAISPHRAAEALKRLRARAPRVHCITNAVAQAFTANVLLAIGAVPSMTIAPEEVPDFTARADALLVNLGTLDATRRGASLAAVDVALERNRPWVLDPVFADVSQPRLIFARDLAARRPAALRLNASEFAALTGRDANEDSAAALARETASVVAVTGPSDLVADGVRHASIANGHVLMTKVTAMGCAISAVAAAFLAAERDRFAAVAAALATVGLAGERAAEASRGPGTFAAAILDGLALLSPEDLERGARIY